MEISKSVSIMRVKSIHGSLEDIPTGIWLTKNGDLLHTGIFESAVLPVEQGDVYNDSELNVFQHVSGIYYDRRPYSFLARHSGFSNPVGQTGKSKDQILVYPNPSRGQVLVEMGEIVGDEVIVVDMQGKIVYRDRITENPIRLDLQEQAAGMYMLSVIGTEHIIHEPLLILH